MSAARDVAEQLALLADEIKQLKKALQSPPRKSWTPQEVASSTGLTYWTVMVLINRGDLRATKAGKGYLVADDEVNRFLKEGPARPAA